MRISSAYLLPFGLFYMVLSLAACSGRASEEPGLPFAVPAPMQGSATPTSTPGYLPGEASVVKYSPDGKLILTVHYYDAESPSSLIFRARIWDATTGRLQAILSGHGGPISAAEFSPDGRHVLTAGSDGARIWDAVTGEELVRLRGEGWRGLFLSLGCR